MKIYVAWQGIHELGGAVLGSTTFNSVKGWRTSENVRKIELEIMRLNRLQVVSLTNVIELTDEVAR